MSLEMKPRKRSMIDNVEDNKKFEEDTEWSILYTQKLLAMLGIWPFVKEVANKKELLRGFLLISTSLVLIAFIMVPLTIYAARPNQTLKKRMKVFGPIVIRVANLMKWYWIIYRRKEIKICFAHLKSDWKMASNVWDREIMIKNASVGRRITFVSLIFMYITAGFYQIVLPFLRGKKVDAFNRTIRPFAYPVYDKFPSAQSSPQYEIIFYTTFISALVTYTTIIAACGLVATFVTHASGQIEIIMYRLNTLFDNMNDDLQLLNTRVGVVIRSHVRVLRLTDTIEEALRELCFTEVISSTFLICSLGWRVAQWRTGDHLSAFAYFLYLVTITYNLFIFCYIGELLKEQCALIGKATYLIDWWKMPGKTGQSLILIIAMANIPRSLTAGGIMELSVTTFASIVKTAVAYIRFIMSREWH
ncbi:odorant receptor 9a-like [Venturia canescens]|uniref:odorant receptor 9a-like n=1 Tax=Venturia canescens TaxID=32260 RepID=UPI001C9C8BF1|nr:odorant receptor 9a-like [Venturia canescens]